MKFFLNSPAGFFLGEGVVRTFIFLSSFQQRLKKKLKKKPEKVSVISSVAPSRQQVSRVYQDHLSCLYLT